ncbi:D-alanyl-D-alanine carboxypeptidase family protein [Caldisalinibacter kiritimatiensis]|uniref:serine-type D-Ala-D-Ala carboxypeptidase n=1 Tax=Caldisalinibacter kiritimatiensis TaxID=1304284 RepID=R1CE41_9FIRM|nr:D-alanyl-D-alanine carboxypeptidase family protein [Caldisalinibacter kiritimatiensis]EOD00540.1 D-alanyl-D-alanine carboxypeptidase [Caldisalinibacter kiritimatiensis]
MKKIFTFIIVITILFTNIAYADGNIEDGLKSVLLGEYKSGEIVYNYNVDTPMEIASITKLMTYLVTMDLVSEGKVGLDDIVTVSQNASRVGGSSFNLKAGERVKLSTLLDSILIVSGNDSCVAIAEYVAGTEEKFVEMMNKKAKDIGLKTARFLNSSGLPEKDGQNMMSTRDIFKLSRYVISKYPKILNATRMINLNVETRNFNKENTNSVLRKIPELDGLKTGYTDLAGYCLVSTLPVMQSSKNTENFRLIGIIMGAKSEEQRRNKTIELLKYGIDNYEKRKIILKNQVIETIKVYGAKNENLDLLASKDYSTIVKKGANISKDVEIKKDITAPVKKGEVIGKVTIYIDNKKEEEIELIASRTVYKANVFMRIFRYLMDLIGLIGEY